MTADNHHGYRYTNVSRNAHHREMAVTLAHALPHLNWRHHGIGLLQAYLTETEPEVRVHIWHPSLQMPGIEDSGSIHTHRFTLESHVLVGAIEHTEYSTYDDPRGDWQRYEVLHARLGKTDPPTPIGSPCTVEMHGDVIYAGETYFFVRGYFHKGLARDLAVTLVTKHHQIDTPAQILGPRDGNVVHAFVQQIDRHNWEPIIEQAKKALLAVNG
jgi:hypothetical protein